MPGDFSLIGCDDMLGTITDPTLTSVSNRSREAAPLTVSPLLEMLHSRAIRDGRYVLETHPVTRDTTSPLRE